MAFVGRNAIIELTYQIGYDDNRPTSVVVSVSRRKRKRSAVWKEQNMPVE